MSRIKEIFYDTTTEMRTAADQVRGKPITCDQGNRVIYPGKEMMNLGPVRGYLERVEREIRLSEFCDVFCNGNCHACEDLDRVRKDVQDGAGEIACRTDIEIAPEGTLPYAIGSAFQEHLRNYCKRMCGKQGIHCRARNPEIGPDAVFERVKWDVIYQFKQADKS